MVERSNASEQKAPEAVYLPNYVFEWFKGQAILSDEFLPEEQMLLNIGMRISPQGVRTLIQASVFGVSDGETIVHPPNPYFFFNAINYGVLTGFIKEDEVKPLLENAKPFHGDMCSNPQSFYSSNHNWQMGSIVGASIDSLIAPIENAKEHGATIALFHGKWNGIPHAGYTNLIRDLCAYISVEEDIEPNNIYAVVMCESNDYMCATGNIPFLSTMWRVSMMSYIPYVNACCPSGLSPNVHPDMDKHYSRIYGLLRPDYVNVAEDNPHIKNVVERCQEYGAKPVVIPRESSFGPVGIGRGTTIPSSSTIANGSADFAGFIRELNHSFLIRKTRLELYGGPNWFTSPNIMPPWGRPDVVRKTIERYAPETAVVLPSGRSNNKEMIHLPEKEKDPRNKQVKKALKELSFS